MTVHPNAVRDLTNGPIRALPPSARSREASNGLLRRTHSRQTGAEPVPNGFAQNTVARVVKVRPGTTREELYQWALNQMPAEMRGGNTLCFSAEPNTLGGA